MMEKKRSVGITILSVLEIFVGTMLTTYGICWNITNTDIMNNTYVPTFLAFLVIIIGVLTFLLSIIGWVLQFFLVVGVLLFSIAVIVLREILYGGQPIGENIAIVACIDTVPLLLFFYITRSKIKKQFGRRVKVIRKDIVVLSTIIILGAIFSLIFVRMGIFGLG